MTFWVYVLSCSNEKWYVGSTQKKPVVRFEEHLGNCFSSFWCRKYRPLCMTQTLQCKNKLEMLVTEKLITFELMRAKGYENVRGANFCQLKPIILSQLCWDMGHLLGEDARVLAKTLQPYGPCLFEYTHLIKETIKNKESTKSKYFI
jgi:predicted GIY-YIG superfamily endonuclease